jgi:hypothetical protein
MTFLRKVGIELTFDRKGQARTRTIFITYTPEKDGTGRSAPSAPSATSSRSNGTDSVQREIPANSIRDTLSEGAADYEVTEQRLLGGRMRSVDADEDGYLLAYEEPAEEDE